MPTSPSSPTPPTESRATRCHSQAGARAVRARSTRGRAGARAARRGSRPGAPDARGSGVRPRRRARRARRRRSRARGHRGESGRGRSSGEDRGVGVERAGAQVVRRARRRRCPFAPRGERARASCPSSVDALAVACWAAAERAAEVPGHLEHERLLQPRRRGVGLQAHRLPGARRARPRGRRRAPAPGSAAPRRWPTCGSAITTIAASAASAPATRAAVRTHGWRGARRIAAPRRVPRGRAAARRHRPGAKITAARMNSVDRQHRDQPDPLDRRREREDGGAGRRRGQREPPVGVAHADRPRHPAARGSRR